MKMIIEDVLNCHIDPFEIEDEQLKSLFSFFLHLAPSIDSRSSIYVQESKLTEAWYEFLFSIGISNKEYHFYHSGNITDGRLIKYCLSTNDPINRKRKGFICCFKQGEKHEIECLLRHIRNSIAHSNVFVLIKRRKYIIFDDYNRNNNMTARIIISQTDLTILKRLLNKGR